MIFEFDDPEVREKYFDLWYSLDGTQPCYDDPDLYVENWTGRPIPEDAAERLCAGCKFLEKCGAYALVADETTGIWGGMTPEQRKRMKNGN